MAVIGDEEVALAWLEPGEWLVDHRRDLERSEARWLLVLAEFDLQHRWAGEGQLSAAEWLMWRMGMSRATAYEKLRIAHALRRRPVLQEAYCAGRVSYSAVRAMARMENPDREVDEAMVALAEQSSVLTVERAVRFYLLHADQERPPPDPESRRGVRVVRGLDGTTTLQITVTDLEAAGGGDPAEESARADSPEESARADWSPRVWAQRRADAFMDAVRAALASDGHAVGDDRYMVHVVSTVDGTRLVDGTPLDEGVAARVGCDASVVEHVVGEDGEPLWLGRRRRMWSTAQRRAILVRDGGHCRFPGCSRRIVDVHHVRPWEDGGPTDVGNGILACTRHHTLLHGAFRAVGDANGPLEFRRTDGVLLAYG
jgi:hypothetical protein